MNQENPYIEPQPTVLHHEVKSHTFSNVLLSIISWLLIFGSIAGAINTWLYFDIIITDEELGFTFDPFGGSLFLMFIILFVISCILLAMASISRNVKAIRSIYEAIYVRK